MKPNDRAAPRLTAIAIAVFSVPVAAIADDVMLEGLRPAPVALALVTDTSRAGRMSSVALTPHNLSVSGPGAIRATAETEICVFCHTSHSGNASEPLWNRELPSGPFIPYASPTLDAWSATAPPQPDGASKLCLSCHDGTLALGAVSSREKNIDLVNTVASRMPPQARGYLSRDLSGTHPISFAITDRLVAENNAKDSPLATVTEIRSDPDVRLDSWDKMQCTTCHDPHDDANFATSGIHFYAKPRFSDVCRVCHKL